MKTYDIYRNLHARSPDETWSVIDRSTGRVILRTGHLNLASAALIVQPAGAAKVFATQRKHVHAFVRVKAESWNAAIAEGEGFANDGSAIEWRATYRPKLGWDSFRYAEGPYAGQPVHFTPFAILNNQGRMYIR
jgi:hypothetical protein